jgi:hypothetical protein
MPLAARDSWSEASGTYSRYDPKTKTPETPIVRATGIPYNKKGIACATLK